MFKHHLIYIYGSDESKENVKLHLEEKLNLKTKCLDIQSDLYRLYLLNGEVDFRKLGNISTVCHCPFIVYAEIGIFDDSGCQYTALNGNLIDDCLLKENDVAAVKEKYNLDNHINF